MNLDLRRAFEHEDLDVERIHAILEEIQRGHIELDTTELSHTLKETFGWMEQRMGHNPTNVPLLKRVGAVVDLARSLPFEVDFWDIQNVYYEMQQSVYPAFRERAAAGDAEAQAWVRPFLVLGEKLGFQGPA